MQHRYVHASRAVKSQLRTDACATLQYHRKAAIRAFARPPRTTPPRRRSGRPSPYGPRTPTLLMHIWEAAGYPWSIRLKALLPLWFPWAKRRFTIPLHVERARRTISARTIDRRLGQKKRHLNRRLYGRTKPGTLLNRYSHYSLLATVGAIFNLGTLGRNDTSATPMSDLFRGGIPYDFAFFEGFDLPELLRATAWRTSALKADSSTSSPSWMSIARRAFPSRLELKRRDGSFRDAPLEKVSFTTFL